MDTSLVLLLALICLVLLWYLYTSTKPPITFKPSAIPFDQRNHIEYNDLLDARVREDPHAFNRHICDKIMQSSDDKTIQNGIIPVHGEKNAFLICKYRPIKEILANEKVYSSNPFADERLIAPNAMDDNQHKVIMKYLKKYYSTSTVTKQIPVIEKIIKRVVETFIHRQRINQQIDRTQKRTRIHSQSPATETTADAMHGICRLVVMRTALFMLGLTPKQYNSVKTVNTLIQFNDQMVKLVAPVGGVGFKWRFSFIQLLNVLFGLLFATLPTLRLICKIGVGNAWSLLRPDLNVLRLLLPGSNTEDGIPRTQVWVYPNILYAVPAYFLYLNELYETYGVNVSYPNVSRETNVIDGKNVLQSLHDAEVNGDMSRAEVLVTLVQLMVNMTTANAIGNMLYRLSEKELLLSQCLCSDDGEYDEQKAMKLIEEVLRLDASLQRLPRRCRVNVENFYGQKFPENSNLLLMIGLANCEKEVFGDDAFEFKPDRFVDEKLSKRLTFGYGIHLCLGYLLVKREMNLTLKALVENNVEKIVYKASRRVVDTDVGNYGFQRLHIELSEKR